MSNYQPRIMKNSDGSFYALVVRMEGDEAVVINHYKGRHFKTLKAAQRSTQNYIAKFCN